MPEPVETEPSPSSAAPTPAVDRGAVRQLQDQLGEDGLAELLAMFLDRAPDRLDGLREAVAGGDASSIRAAADSVKGAARSFGAAEMGEIAARIEHDSAAGSLEHADQLVGELAASFERTRAELYSLELVGAAETHLESSPQSHEDRIADLERRLACLEQSVISLRSRVDG